MAGLQDMMARAAAAQGGMQDVPPGMGEVAPEEMQGGMGGAQDLEAALDGVEQALVGMGDDVVAEIRIHLNAIRDLAAQGEGSGGAEAPEASEMAEPQGGIPAPKME